MTQAGGRLKGRGRAGNRPKVKGRPPSRKAGPLESDRLAVPFNDPDRISPDHDRRKPLTAAKACPAHGDPQPGDLLRVRGAPGDIQRRKLPRQDLAVDLAREGCQ